MKARRLALLAATGLAVALFLSQLLAWRRVGQLAQFVASSQGTALLRAFQVGHPPTPGRSPPPDLAPFLAANEAFGLRWVAIVRPDGSAVVEAGTRPPGELPLGPGAVAEGPVWLVAGPPPPFDPEGPQVVVGFEPLLSTEMTATATRNLGLSAAAAVMLITTAVWSARAAARAEAAQAAEARSRQLASLGEMSAVLAHEIRNPLASLKGHAQLLEESLAAADRAKAGRVVREAARLERLTDDLLAFARTGRIETVPVDVGALLGELLTAWPGVRLSLEALPDRWPADPLKLRSALENLVRNASEASDRVEVAAGVEAGWLVIRVRDHGPGLPEGEAARVFEPFFTTRSQGTGLGLVVVQRVVEGHGGRVAAHTHPEGGAVFEIRLPG